MKNNWFTITYTLIACLVITSSLFTSLHFAHYFFKPLLVSSLLVYYLFKTNFKPNYITLCLALLFSVLGDTFLMFDAISETYFILGLVAFLIAHIMYCFLFLKNRNKKLNILKPLILFSVYGSLIFLVLKDYLANMLVPVVIYMLVILTMGLLAYLRKGSVNKISFTLVFYGALFFMLSDTILAINKFYYNIPLSSIFILSTYSIAQYLITFGIIKEKKIIPVE